MTSKILGRGALGVAAGTLLLTGLTTLAPTADAAAPGFVAKSALINGATASIDVGITSNGSPISLERYAAERAGYTVTVVDGPTWAAMTAADFARYQLLIVGDNQCGDLDESATNWDTWAPVVMGATPANGIRGNRVLSGLDPSYHYQSGDAGPTDPANPASARTEHFVEAALRFAGATPNATGIYFGPGCLEQSEAWGIVGNKLSASGTGFAPVTDVGLDAVDLVQTPAATFPGLAPADLPSWGSTAHTYFDAFPTDYRPLAIATDTPEEQVDAVSEEGKSTMAKKAPATGAERNGDKPGGEGDKSSMAPAFSAAEDDSTCALKVSDGTNVCGEAVVVFAGSDPAPPAPPAPVLTCQGKKATILGTGGNDVLQGTAGPDVIVSLGGDDKIRGKGGKDVICAGDGNDLVRGGEGRDRIYGENGDDELRGNAGRDRVSGGAGNDRVFGGDGPDRLSGEAGNDVLGGGNGPDSLNGGDGNDNGDGGPGKNFYKDVEQHP